MSSKTVVIAVDGSKNADHAFEKYCEIMHLRSNKLIALHIEDQLAIPADQALTLSESHYEKICKEHNEDIEALKANYRSKAQRYHIEKYEFRSLLNREPGVLICEFAENVGAIQIVMGTRGLGLIRRTVLGSVSDYVVTHAKTPVTIIPMAAN